MDTWLDGFLVSFLESKKSLLNVSLCIVSSIEKCWRAKKYHLNLIISCRMWLKFSTTLNSMPLIQSVCAALKWTQGTLLVLYIEVRLLSKCVSLARGFEFMRATPEISFRKIVTAGSTYLWHKVGPKPYSLVWHIQPVQWTHSVTSAVLKLADKAAVFRTNWNHEGNKWGLGVWTIQTSAESLKETEPQPSFSQLEHDHLSQLFKGVWALLYNHKRPGSWEGMDPWPICEQARWINFVHARRRSTAWDCKWWWP